MLTLSYRIQRSPDSQPNDPPPKGGPRIANPDYPKKPKPKPKKGGKKSKHTEE